MALHAKEPTAWNWNSEHFGLYKHSPIPLYGKLEVHSVERMYLRQRCPTAVASLVCGLRHFRRITKIIHSKNRFFGTNKQC